MFFLHILILYHLLEEVIFTLYYLYTTTKVLENDIELCGYGKVTEENAMEYAKWNVEYYGKDGFYCEHKSFSPEKKVYRREVYSAEHVGTERHYFISEVKEDSGYDWRTDSHKKKARANMEVFNGGIFKPYLP